MTSRSSMETCSLEWAELAPRITVVATPDKGWIHRPGAWDGFSTPMKGEGSPDTTRQLLDTAMLAARQEVVRGRKPRERRELTPALWAWSLCAAYVTTRATPGLLAEAAERFARTGRLPLARWAAERAEEERGHDELALRDLRALGLEAERAVQVFTRPDRVALVEYFTRCVRAEDPVGCVGYSYVLERRALTLGADFIRAVEAMLPPGIHATRCLRVHSAVGSDVQHVRETLTLVAGLSPEERVQVALACYEAALLMYGEESPPDESTLTEQVEKLRVLHSTEGRITE